MGGEREGNFWEKKGKFLERKGKYGPNKSNKICLWGKDNRIGQENLTLIFSFNYV